MGKWIHEGVKEILEIASDVYKEHNRHPVEDIVGAAKLYVEIRDEAKRIFVDDKLRKRFIRGIIEWGIFCKKYKFGSLYNKVIDYLSEFELDEIKEKYVKDFLTAYLEYSAKRWSIRPDVSVNEDVIKSAKIAKAICKELNISMDEYMRLNHECWEKIRRPLSMKALSDEIKCRKRIQVCKDLDRKKGVMKKDDYEKGVIARKWKEILDYGVEKFLSRTNSNGYLTYVAKLYVEDMKKNKLSKDMLEKIYSPSRVEQMWEKVKGGMKL